jgi:hypothetical protein
MAVQTTVKILEIPLYNTRKRGTTPIALSITSKIRALIKIWGGKSYQGPSPSYFRAAQKPH